LENPTLEVYALGPGYALFNGQYISDWEGNLPRLLFFYVLARPMCTRTEICQAFWPELSVDQAVNVFHVTKRRLHKALGFDVLLHEDGHYQINTTLNLQYDIIEFVSSLVEARLRSNKTSEEYWLRAINLYRGCYLQGDIGAWLMTHRSDFRSGYLEALSELAQIREDAGQVESALGLFLRGVGEAYDREDFHKEVIRLYSKLGRQQKADEYYHELRRNFREQYGYDLSPETTSLISQEKLVGR
jgi:two-component SAPR family response regulator